VLSYNLSLITIHISDYRQFSDIHMSQGSVATYVRCRGIFKYQFVANLPLSLPVQEFWKSVNIWESYGQEFSVLFFDSRCLRRSLFLVESTIYSIFNIMAANVVIRECCCIKKTPTHYYELQQLFRGHKFPHRQGIIPYDTTPIQCRRYDDAIRWPARHVSFMRHFFQYAVRINNKYAATFFTQY